MNIIPIQVTDEGVLIPKTYLRNASEVEVVTTTDYFLIKPRQQLTVPQQPTPVTHEPQAEKPSIPAPQSTAPPFAPVRRHPLLAVGRSRNPKAATEAANILENEVDRRNFTLQAAKENKEFDLHS